MDVYVVGWEAALKPRKTASKVQKAWKNFEGKKKPEEKEEKGIEGKAR